MPRLVATAPLRYASRNLRAGDAFDASDRDARVLRAAGLAGTAPEPVSAGSTADDEHEMLVAPGKGRYRRRDLRADE